MEKEVLQVLCNQDTVYREEDTVIIRFTGQRKVASSSLINGGVRNDLTAVINHHSSEKEAMTVAVYRKNMKDLCLRLGYDPHKVSIMGTGVPMKNAVVKSERYRNLTVTAVVTAGAEGNPGRAGEPASVSLLYYKEGLPRGTINIMLHYSCNMPDGILMRSIVTATEAKSAALQELQIGSRYSYGLATGTGTDQILAICDPAVNLLVEDCGKNSKTGEITGRLVKDAVKEALYLQNSFCSKKMHSIEKRMYRFGINEEKLYQDYCSLYGVNISPEAFKNALKNSENDGKTFCLSVLFAHLLDQYHWNLISDNEFKNVASVLRKEMAGEIPVRELSGRNHAEPELKLWEECLLALIHHRYCI